MIELSVGQIASVVGGTLVGVDPDRSVRDVVVDSRQDVPDALYVAIRGERVDGHDFAADVIARGAAAVLADHDLSVPCIVVDDPVLALGRLAAWVRRTRLTASVVAVTGSSGKTSTKDLIAQVLTQFGETVSPVGSFNTEVGLPLTILSADESTRYLVLEMGMRGDGHIAYLADIAEPDVGVVLNVGSAHLGMLGSRDAVASAKGELAEAVRPGGVVVLNADDPLVRQMAQRASAPVLFFGESSEAAVRAEQIEIGELARPSFLLRNGDDVPVDVHLALSGEHNVSNALAAAAACLSLGLPLAGIASALSAAVTVSKWRMEVSQAPGGFTVINDSYNANPESMRAALKALVAMSQGRRSWAVLGEMRELGEDSLAEHDALGRLAVRLDVSRLVCVGERTRVMHLAASNEGSWADESIHVPDVDSALVLLRAELRPGDVVLIKASRSVGLERIAQGLLEVSG